MATRHKPRRGYDPHDRELIYGDEGEYEKQGGAAPGPSESGNLMSREFGVPQADIPGGKTHLVNPETQHHRPPARPQQQPVVNAHGVPPNELQYSFPSKADEIGKAPRPAPEPKHLDDVVPVRIVAEEGEAQWIKKTLCFNVRVKAVQGGDVTRIVDRDEHRLKLKILNEDSTTDIRVSHQEEELMTASAQGTGIAGSGALIYHATNSYTDLEDCQDALFGVTTSTSLTALLSVIVVTAVPATHGQA